MSNRNDGLETDGWRAPRRFHAGAAVLALTQLLGCGNQLVGWPSTDITAPTVTSTAPANGATGAPLAASITATFSEPMSPATISAASFVLFDGATPIPGAVTYTGVTATFDPIAALTAGRTYTASIRDLAEDLAGNPLAADYTWTFTTGTSLDTTRPVVVLTVPDDGAIGAPIDGSLLGVFSEAMDPATLTTATFLLASAAGTVTGVVTLVGATATFNPTASLAVDTDYTAIITTGALDLSGNSLAANYVWTFRTGPVGPGAPTVIVTDPDDLAVGVPVSTTVSATFSEDMNPLTITTANFEVVGPAATPVTGTVLYDVLSRTGTFTPSADLRVSTTYTATIRNGATDLGGTAMVADYVWTFTTGPAVDPGVPTVILTDPVDLAMNVPVTTAVRATFSERMAPATMIAANFRVTGPGATLVAGTVLYDGPSQTLRFTPTGGLSAMSTYTATVTVGATDLGGTPLAADYVWTFTTASTGAAPTVVLTDPLDLAMNVPVSTTVSATFSEAMAVLTMTGANFRVTGPGLTPVPGALIYSAPSLTATFTPASDLLATTTYTATVTTGATDVGGTPMVADHVWTFSTGPGTGRMPVDLGSLSTFVAVAGAGLTNSNSSGITMLNGDVGLSPTPTCLGDGAPCTLTNPVITGTLYANDPGGVAARAKVDLTAAYVDAMSRPVGTTVNDLSGMVLPGGVYTSGSTMSIAVGGTVTLDGGGDPNTVWIFQIGSSLTVNNNARVLLINGAMARNVFWAAFASSTIGSNVSFQGTVMAGASNSVGTDSTVVGRLLCTTGQITLLSNTITLPL